MKNIAWIFALLIAGVFVSCEDENMDLDFGDGTILFDLSGLSINEDAELKSASSDHQVQIETSINNIEYYLSEGEALILPVNNYTLTKFDVFINGVHKYMIGGCVEFQSLPDEIGIVQIPLYRVDDENNTYGKNKFEIIESAYQAIKSGRSSYALFYNTDKESRLLDAASVNHSAAEGFPALRLYNGFNCKTVEYTYYKQNGNEIYTHFVNPNTQLYVALPNGHSAEGSWVVTNGAFEKTISIN